MNINEFIGNNTDKCEQTSKYFLILQRWSKQEPYWCLFIGENAEHLTSEECNKTLS